MLRDDDPRLGMIRANTALVIAELGPLSGREFGLDRDSVAWIDAFIERRRAEGGGDKLVSVLGSYLGEAIIAAAGGRWDESERGDVGICFANGNCCYPFSKVAKQLAEGRDGGESTLGFYDFSIGPVAQGTIRSDGG